MLPSGAMPTFENRCRWASWYMVKAGVLESPKRGHVAITQRGLALLATKPERIDTSVLSQYPEYKALRKPKSPSGTPTDIGHEPVEDENPEEALFSAYTSWRATIEADLLERLQSQSYPWQSFQRLVVDLLGAMGYGGSDEDRRRVT